MVPSRVHKKKMFAPKSKIMWRRKETPHVVSSQATRDGGCGVVGRQDLKMARTCDVHITSAFREDPHALETVLLEGGWGVIRA
jgi:hypothetical protein